MSAEPGRLDATCSHLIALTFSLDRKMHHGDAAGSILGHVARNCLTFLRRKRGHHCRLALELGLEDAEVRRFAGTLGLHIECIAACLEARQFAHKRRVRLDVIFSEMRRVIGLIVEDEQFVH